MSEKMRAALELIASGVGPIGGRLGYDQMREIARAAVSASDGQNYWTNAATGKRTQIGAPREIINTSGTPYTSAQLESFALEAMREQKLARSATPPTRSVTPKHAASKCDAKGQAKKRTKKRPWPARAT